MVIKRQSSKQTAQAGQSSLDRIMAAAKTEFAKHGLRQTRIEDIASSAGVSQQLVFHYFDNKESLYSEVLAVLGATSTDFLNAVDLDSLEPLQAIEFIIRGIFETNLEYGIRFIADQIILDGEQIIRKNPIWLKHQILMTHIERILLRGRENGTIRSGLTPRELLLVIVSLSIGQSVSPTLVAGPIDRVSPNPCSEPRDWIDVSLALVLTALKTG